MASPPNYSRDEKRREEAVRKRREEKQQRRQQKKGDKPMFALLRLQDECATNREH